MDTLIEIDYADLKPGTLESLIEAFILREGTDYGSNEASFESKIKAVHTQIKNGKVKIVFDPTTESCTLLSEREMSASR